MKGWSCGLFLCLFLGIACFSGYQVLRILHEYRVGADAYFKLEQKELTLAQLNRYPILMLERKCTTSEFLHNLFLQHQLELIPEVELSSNDLLIDLARIGLGIAFIPDYCLRRDSRDLFVLKTKEQMPSRQIVASVSPAMPPAVSTREFLDLLPTL